MKKINPTDTLLATVVCRGMTLCSSRLTGLSSVADVYRALQSIARRGAGIVTLVLRNLTQGWSAKECIILNS